MKPYTSDQLAALDPAAIAQASPRHIQSVLEQLIATAQAKNDDADRYRWICDGNGYFMEEEMLCGSENEKAKADAVIDAERGTAK